MKSESREWNVPPFSLASSVLSSTCSLLAPLPVGFESQRGGYETAML